jgi:cytochrome o ubiquinol oxidase subunit 3
MVNRMSAHLHPGLNLGSAHGAAHERSEPVLFGFWIFLMSDLITFGILFATYATNTGQIGLAGGPGPGDLFDLKSIGLQTGFLLASSLTCGMASLALKYDEGTSRVAQWLVVTALLGGGFLAFEVRDFASMISSGGTPMRSAWLSSLYALVGLHGLHVTMGLIWIAVMLALLAVAGLSDRFKTRLLMFALYWHFLDLLWIGIFSVVFLAGMT